MEWGCPWPGLDHPPGGGASRACCCHGPPFSWMVTVVVGLAAKRRDEKDVSDCLRFVRQMQVVTWDCCSE